MIFRKARPWKILFAARLPRQNSLTAVPKRCTVFLFKKNYLEYLCAAAPVVATHSGILSPSSHYNYLVPGVFVRSSTRCCNTLRHPLTRLTLYNNYLVPGVFVRSSTLRCYTLQHPLTRLTLYSNYLVPGVFVRSSTSCCYSEADPDPWNPYHFPGSGSKNGWIRNPDTESRSRSGSN